MSGIITAKLRGVYETSGDNPRGANCDKIEAESDTREWTKKKNRVSKIGMEGSGCRRFYLGNDSWLGHRLINIDFLLSHTELSSIKVK